MTVYLWNCFINLHAIVYLCNVFNGVDVMVGRGANQPHPRDRVTRRCNLLRHLVAEEVVLYKYDNDNALYLTYSKIYCNIICDKNYE